MEKYFFIKVRSLWYIKILLKNLVETLFTKNSMFGNLSKFNFQLVASAACCIASIDI